MTFAVANHNQEIYKKAMNTNSSIYSLVPRLVSKTVRLCVISLMLAGCGVAFSSVANAAESDFTNNALWAPKFAAELRQSQHPVIGRISPKLIVVQNDKTPVRSRSDVVKEVKRRYNAEVLKIQLNQSRTAYRVRILMPNGRVREVTVSARR